VGSAAFVLAGIDFCEGCEFFLFVAPESYGAVSVLAESSDGDEAWCYWGCFDWEASSTTSPDRSGFGYVLVLRSFMGGFVSLPAFAGRWGRETDIELIFGFGRGG
jgi:hypothetical protein